MVHSRAFQRNAEKIDSLLCWIDYHITDEGEHTEWVRNMTFPIIKATMSFIVKFFWTIVRIRLSPTQAAKVVT